jgi:CopG antitoxin of type II toxin-antitoxin system
MPNEEDTEITRSSISNATSYEEIGEFWDEHSLDEYWEQTYPVEFTINLVPKSRVTYYGIDKRLSEKISAVAEPRGMTSENLLNLWVQEKLQEEMV